LRIFSRNSDYKRYSLPASWGRTVFQATALDFVPAGG
jgi:hypothetical protein